MWWTENVEKHLQACKWVMPTTIHCKVTFTFEFSFGNRLHGVLLFVFSHRMSLWYSDYPWSQAGGPPSSASPVLRWQTHATMSALKFSFTRQGEVSRKRSWWHRAIISTLGKLRQEDGQSKGSSRYIVRLCVKQTRARDTTQWRSVSLMGTSLGLDPQYWKVIGGRVLRVLVFHVTWEKVIEFL